MKTTQTEVFDPNLQSRARARYDREMASLQALGFRPFGFCLEALGPYSAILHLPILVFMLVKKEVVVFPRPARLGVVSALQIHSTPSAVALCMGKGIKFYTGFDNDAMLISSTFESYAISSPESPITLNPHCPTAEEAWLLHKKGVRDMENQGRVVHATASVCDYIEMSQRENVLF